MGPNVVPGELIEKNAPQGGAPRAGIDSGPFRLQGGGFAGEIPDLTESLFRRSETHPERMDRNRDFESDILEEVAVKLPEPELGVAFGIAAIEDPPKKP